MKNLIAAAVIATDPNAIGAITAASANSDGSEKVLMRQLKERAQQVDDNDWEVMMAVAAKAADLLAGKAREGFGGDATVDAEVIQPLMAFTESFNANPAAWLSHNVDGFPIAAEMAAGLLKVMVLLQENTSLRLHLLNEVNGSLEKFVMSGDVKIVIDAKTSQYTKKVLKPMSKRNLTEQIISVVTFLKNNPDGFSIH